MKRLFCVVLFVCIISGLISFSGEPISDVIKYEKDRLSVDVRNMPLADVVDKMSSVQGKAVGNKPKIVILDNPESETGWKKQVIPEISKAYENVPLSEKLVNISIFNATLEQFLDVLELRCDFESYKKGSVYYFHPRTGTFSSFNEKTYTLKLPESQIENFDARTYLASLGIKFYEGAFAHFDRVKGILHVKNTPEQLLALDLLVTE